MAGAYVVGGQNKLVYGDEVTAGSSGGNTSYNPATGKTHYVAGYENQAAPTPAAGGATAATAGLKAAKPGGGGGGGSKTATKAAAAPKQAAAAPVVDAGAGGGSAIAPSGGGAGGGDMTGSGSLGGLQSALSQSQMGMDEGAPPPMMPLLGLRAGLGMRNLPDASSMLRGAGRIY